MLDELLGRAELKARVAELEEEAESLRRRHEAESERRSEAVRKRQEAEERANRLAHRVEELEDRVDRLQSGEAEPTFRGRERLSGDRLAAVLALLRSVETGPEAALTAMVVDGSDLPDAVVDALGERAALVRRAAPALVFVDDAGLVAAALDPPVAPAPFADWGDGFRVEEAWFRPVGRHALAVVRSDLFAVGSYEEGRRVDVRGFTSAVKGDHSKGGFSQGRFERLREGQIADHVDRCREALTDVEADRLFVVGEKSLLHEFEDLADVTEPVDATGDPEEALSTAAASFWEATLHLL